MKRRADHEQRRTNKSSEFFILLRAGEIITQSNSQKYTLTTMPRIISYINVSVFAYVSGARLRVGSVRVAFNET